MKILFFTHYSELYGANKSLLDLIDGLVLVYKIEPYVILPYEGDLMSVLNENKIPFEVVPFHQWCEIIQRRSRHPYRYIKNVIQTKKRIKKINKFNGEQIYNVKEKIGDFAPDFVYSNSSVFNFGYLFAKKYHIKHIWHFREFGEKDYNLVFFNKKNVIHCFNKSDKIIAISNAIKFFYKTNYFVKNIEVAHNSVLSMSVLEKIDKRKENKKVRNSSEIVFGIVGLLHKNKGQEDAIRAFKLVNSIYPETKLLIVGTGNQHDLLNLSTDLNITSKVDFLGHLADPFDAFLNMDVNLMCSRNEGLGRVTIEAMAASIPTIGYRGGGTIEIVEEYKTGLFYENNYQDLSEKMIFLIENESKRIEMGINARKIFQEKYINEIYASSIYEIITN